MRRYILAVCGGLVFIGLISENKGAILFGLIFAVLFLLNEYWRKHVLDRILYKRSFSYTRGFPGETIQCSIQLSNHKRLPIIWANVNDAWPKELRPTKINYLTSQHKVYNFSLDSNLSNEYHLVGQKKIVRNYEIELKQRGIYNVGPVMIEAGDLLGLEPSKVRIQSLQNIIVFPRVFPINQLPTEVFDPSSTKAREHTLFEDMSNAIGIRNYQTQDGFRRIHWSATARTGELKSKVYQTISSDMHTFCLNMVTTKDTWVSHDAKLQEYLLELTASLIYHNLQARNAVGFFTNGITRLAAHHGEVLPSNSPKQLGHLLSILAGMTPYIRQTFENYLVQHVPRIPFGSSLTLITAFTTPSLVETLHRIRMYRRQITLISLDQTPPQPIPGVKVVSMPFNPEQ